MEQDSITILSQSKERRIKVILIGDQSVGKSKLLEQLLNVESKVNDKEIQTVDFSSLVLFYLIIQNRKYLYGLPQGNQKYVTIYPHHTYHRNLIRAFLIKSHIYVIAFSLNNPVSFENAVNTWFAQCYKNARETNNYYYFIGTMSDKEHLCGSYQDIIQIIADKCQELKIEKIHSKCHFLQIRHTQDSQQNGMTTIQLNLQKQIAEQCVRFLQGLIRFYSETSAVIKTGIERSSSIFIRLLQAAVKQEFAKDGIEPIIAPSRTASRFSMAQMQVPIPVVVPTSSARQSTQTGSLQVSMAKDPVPFLPFEQKESKSCSMAEIKKEQNLCCMIQ